MKKKIFFALLFCSIFKVNAQEAPETTVCNDAHTQTLKDVEGHTIETSYITYEWGSFDGDCSHPAPGFGTVTLTKNGITFYVRTSNGDIYDANDLADFQDFLNLFNITP